MLKTKKLSSPYESPQWEVTTLEHSDTLCTSQITMDSNLYNDLASGGELGWD